MPSQYYLNSVFPQNHEATLQPQPYHTTLLPYSGNAAILPQWYQTTKMLSYHLSHITPPPWYNNTTLLPNCDAKSYYHALQWPSPSQKHTVTHSYATPFNPTHSSTDHPAPLCGWLLLLQESCPFRFHVFVTFIVIIIIIITLTIATIWQLPSLSAFSSSLSLSLLRF